MTDQLELDSLELPGLTNIALFTDIHFGAKQNSILHNEDCLQFVRWFKKECIAKNASAIGFLGDWFESRNAINTLTSKFSIRALRELNTIGIPIFFIVGNHDLYHRHNREVHSAEIFKELEFVKVIERPTIINDKYLFLPFLFSDEYPQVVNLVNASEYVFGHFEFRNFYLTGTNQISDHGFLHKLFDGPKHIFSGHYHKRQASENVIYIGSPFGTSYADAGDFERGYCWLDIINDEVDFIDYDGPTYYKIKLSQIVDGFNLREKARVKCVLDQPLTYSEAQQLKADIVEAFDLREFTLEEDHRQRQHALEESALAELEDLDLSSLDETVKKLIETGVQATTTIDPALLIEIYEELK